MLKLDALVLLTALQSVSCYRQFHLTPSRVLEPQNNSPQTFLNSDNIDFARRRGRQIGQLNNGFQWDESPSEFRQSSVNQPRPSKSKWASNRVVNQDGGFIFEDEFESRYNILRTTERLSFPGFTTQRSTSTVAVPGMGTPRTPCEDRCQTTPEYNPVCGDDSMTYFSRSRLICAQKCGKSSCLKAVTTQPLHSITKFELLLHLQLNIFFISLMQRRKM